MTNDNSQNYARRTEETTQRPGYIVVRTNSAQLEAAAKDYTMPLNKLFHGNNGPKGVQ